MNILRTDGGGASTKNKRLKIIREILKYHEINHINLLHDHKGILIVVWEKEPSNIDKITLTNTWKLFNEIEIEHKLVKYIDI
jgi:hypothetical protein